MFFVPTIKSSICPNCGLKDFDPKKIGEACEKCGYHTIASKELPPIDLIFCEGCGCTLSSACGIHPENKQKKVKL